MLIIIMVFVSFVSFSQKRINETQEAAALKYFCSNIGGARFELEKQKIVFSNKTEGRPSYVYYIADCLGEINFLKDSIPIMDYLDSLDDFYNEKSFEVFEVRHDCKYLRKRAVFFLNKRIYKLHLYNAIEYKSYSYVEIHLVNKSFSHLVFIVKFEMDEIKPIKQYLMNFYY